MIPNQAQLKLAAEECAAKVRTAKVGSEYFTEPYKHIVIDNFLPVDLAESCRAAFPEPESASWERTNDADIEVKLRTKWKSEFEIPDGILPSIRILNSSLFLSAMAERIDIPKLIPDPYFTGGGLNITMPGGLLDVHVDGNYHDATGLNRRLNAIVYLNPNWQAGWGGEFGIYDSTGETCVKKVAPVFNRLVIFDSHDFSFHGLPSPLSFPEGETRKSLILYYYTFAPRPANQTNVSDPHSALWKKRGLLDKRGNKTRNFT